jgi:predicted transcriptional regulator
MTTLKVGIASYAEMKARTIAVARGERRVAPGEPKVWFSSTESFAKVLSAGNRDLLRVIAEKAPASLDELSRITGKAKSNRGRRGKFAARSGLSPAPRSSVLVDATHLGEGFGLLSIAGRVILASLNRERRPAR